MPTSQDNLQVFERFYQRADDLLAHATKYEVAVCGRLLASNVAHYKQKYGEKKREEKGTEGLNFRQFLLCRPWLSALHEGRKGDGGIKL